MPKLHYFRNKC